MTMNVSPSKISTHRDCPRKFFGIYVAKFAVPESPALVFGTAVHALAETYMRDGSYPSIDQLPAALSNADGDRAVRCAVALLPHLPKPGRAVVEVWMRRDLPKGQFRGRLDFAEPEVETVLSQVPLVRITDIKTSSNFAYAKTEEMAPHDAQAIAYCAWVLDEEEIDVILWRWLYVLTKAPHSVRSVETLLTRETLAAKWGELVAADVAAVQATAALPSFLAAVAQETACGKYGGCPFLVKCAPLGRTDTALIFSKETDMSKELKRRKPLRRRQPSLAEYNDGARESTPPTPEEAVPDVVDRVITRVERMAPETVNPPESEAGVKDIGGAGPDLGPVRKWKKGELRKWLDDSGYPDLKGTAPQLRFYVQEIKAGRDPRNPAEPATEPVAWASSMGQIEAATLPESVDGRVVGGASIDKDEHYRKYGAIDDVEQGETYSLYVDCVPNVPHTRLENLIAPLARQVAEARTDRDSPGGSDFDLTHLTIPYVQGPARVAGLLLKQIDELSGAIVVDRRLPSSNECLEVLIPSAKIVVRGF